MPAPPVMITLMLAGALVALLRRQRAAVDAPAESGDVPVRLLRWAIGLLPTDRTDWGSAMLGELDRIQGRWERRRFVVGCRGGLVALPRRSGMGVPMATLATVALAGLCVFGVAFLRFGLGRAPFSWVVLGILVALLCGLMLGVSIWLRRPGVAAPGLVGGLFAALSWLGSSRFTFEGILGPTYGPKALVMLVVVPVVIGVAATWHSRDALVGRQAARLAGVVGGLGLFLVSNVAVVALRGGPRDPGATLAGGVSEALTNVTMHSLLLLPFATAMLGWAAATVTARLRSA